MPAGMLSVRAAMLVKAVDVGELAFHAWDTLSMIKLFIGIMWSFWVILNMAGQKAGGWPSSAGCVASIGSGLRWRVGFPRLR